MNLLAVDPGATAGYAFNVDDDVHWGTWKSPAPKRPKDIDENVLLNGERFFQLMQRVRSIIRAHGIEGVALEHNIMPDMSDDNAMLTGGWLCCIQLAVLLENQILEKQRANRRIFGPLKMATAKWRKIYWGKYPKLPDDWSSEKKRAEHKRKAIVACQEEGWDVANDGEAEACLMLVAFRKIMDPEFAGHQGSLV